MGQSRVIIQKNEVPTARARSAVIAAREKSLVVFLFHITNPRNGSHFFNLALGGRGIVHDDDFKPIPARLRHKRIEAIEQDLELSVNWDDDGNVW